MEDLSIYIGAGGVGIVVGLTEVIKRALALPEDIAKRVIPLIGVMLGIGLNALVGRLLNPTPRWEMVVLFGLIAGLASLGLFSGGKAVQGK